MTLPADITRCLGARRIPGGHEVCRRRPHCARYVAIWTQDAPTWADVKDMPREDWLCTDEAYSARIPVVPAPVAEAA
jgi:hypothetical protein